jgi:ATP-dependent Lon protease
VDDVSGELKEQHYTIFYGETGYTYERIFGPYLKGAKKINVKDPYLRANHQVANFLRFCELVVKIGDAESIKLETGADDENQKKVATEKFLAITASLKEHDIIFEYSFNNKIHDREVMLGNGWVIKIGRGFDFFQKPDDWFAIGSSDFEFRPCLETNVDIYKKG